MSGGAAPPRVCFLAAPLAPPATEAMALLLSGLRAAVPEVRWVAPGGAHVTVAFLGRLEPARHPEVVAAASPALAPLPRFELELAGLGGFPSTRRPRVLWLGTGAGRPALDRVAGELRRALEAAGLPVERRAFSAHCTLGRPRRGWSAAQANALHGLPPLRLPAFPVDRVVLFEARSGPEGSAYAPLAVVPLAAARAGEAEADANQATDDPP